MSEVLLHQAKLNGDDYTSAADAAESKKFHGFIKKLLFIGLLTCVSRGVLIQVGLSFLAEIIVIPVMR